MAKGFYVGINNVARKIKEGYVGVGGFTPRELPEGYTQVEYIESSGTQYIDTGFKPNQDTKVVLKVQITDTTIATNNLFGARTSTTSNAFTIGTVNTSYWRHGYNSSTTQTSATIDSNVHEIVSDKNIFSIDGVVVNTGMEGAFICPVNACIGRILASNSTVYAGYGRYYLCQIYDDGTLIRDFIPCTNSSGTAGLYDVVNGVFYANAGSGTFTVGSSDSNAAIARRIKEAFIGIGGIARPCWSGGKPTYYGTATALNTGRWYIAATSIGDYALFGGGASDGSCSTVVKTVDAYNSSLTHTNPSSLQYTAYDLAATTVGNYALFSGGYAGGYYRPYTSAFDNSLTLTTPSNNLLVSVRGLAATTVGAYALFAGGYDGSTRSKVVTAYNTSLTRFGSSIYLSASRQALSATTVGNYALFAGGHSNSSQVGTTTVDAINTSLTCTTPTVLSANRTWLAATTVGDYALFGGGLISGTTRSDVVDVYNTSLTRTTAMSLSEVKQNHAATTVGDYALFGGGAGSDGTAVATVDMYDTSLTRTTPTDFSQSKYYHAATAVGNYALFGGGYSGAVKDVVDVYVVA